MQTLRAMSAETQADLARRLQGLAELEGKSNQIMGLAATVLAVVLAAVSILVDQALDRPFFDRRAWVSWTGIGLLAIGIALPVASLLWSVGSYLKRGIPVGLSTGDLLRALDRGMDEANYLRASTMSYIDGIRLIERSNYGTAAQLARMIWLFIIGLVSVTLAVGMLIVRLFTI